MAREIEDLASISKACFDRENWENKYGYSKSSTVVTTTLSQGQMITQTVNLLKWISSRNFTRELDKEPLLNESPIDTKSSWSVLLIINPALIFMLLFHVHLKVAMLYTCALMLSSRSFHHLLGLLHHIMWHVMWLQCHVPFHCPKIKEKKKKKKIPIKSENKRKRK